MRHAVLDELQRESFSYFIHETSLRNGLVRDKTRKGWPASIAAAGMALAAYPVGVERGLIARGDALRRTLAALRFFWRSPQGPRADATGYRGFYYHFLDMRTGRRAGACELSTIDTALLLAGALTAAAYFTEETAAEDGVRRRFYDYVARGVPDGPDDGTLAPWAVATSLPFAPEIVVPCIRYYREKLELHVANPYGFKATFNPTFPARGRSKWGWVSPHHYGINEGPIVIMIENDRTELVWRLMRSCPYVVAGLRRAGFTGGWL